MEGVTQKFRLSRCLFPLCTFLFSVILCHTVMASWAMAGRKDELWDANRDRDIIHIYVEENDGSDDELDFDDEIPLDLSSLAPTDEW